MTLYVNDTSCVNEYNNYILLRDTRRGICDAMAVLFVKVLDEVRSTGITLTVAPNAGGVSYNRRFSTVGLSRCMPETVQDMATTENYNVHLIKWCYFQ